MKFIADVMLGRLAKRLRLRGIDVLYDNSFDDNTVIRISLQQNRVILTRDNGLAGRPLAANHLLIVSDRVEEQVTQVLDSYPAEAHPLTRCSECNETLISIDKSEARNLVAAYVYKTNDAFLRCEACGRIYWKGTHVDRMESTGII
jgi:uncharacterized protein with PIN domain